MTPDWLEDFKDQARENMRTEIVAKTHSAYIIGLALVTSAKIIAEAITRDK